MEPRRRSIPARRVVVEAAVSFLRSQQHELQRGLAHATDDEVVAEVTRHHDTSREAWTSTVVALRAHAPEDVIESVVALFGFHNRVARGLAEEASLRQEGPIEVGIRRILADQIEMMTDETVALLEALPDGS